MVLLYKFLQYFEIKNILNIKTPAFKIDACHEILNELKPNFKTFLSGAGCVRELNHHGYNRDHIVNALSQWETTLHCTVVSHRLCMIAKWSLDYRYWLIAYLGPLFMMKSSNGNIFRVTGNLCREFIGHRWHSSHKGQWRGPLMFSFICSWINASVNNGEAGDWRRHRAHYDVILMYQNKQGACSIYRSRLTSIGILILKIRRTNERRFHVMTY